MTDTHRDKRLSDASSLQKKLASLHKVPQDDRQEYFHDRMMSAIDDVCTRHKGTKTSSAFSAAQILILKDVVFQVVYILDPVNKVQTGFVAKMRAEWAETSAFKQIGIVVGVLTFIWAGGVGGYHIAKDAWHYLSNVSVSVQEQHDTTQKTTASTPPTTATPAHSTPPP